MNKAFLLSLLSLLYFISCGFKNCTDFTSESLSKPENCYERNVTLGYKCCFFNVLFKTANITSNVCN